MNAARDQTFVVMPGAVKTTRRTTKGAEPEATNVRVYRCAPERIAIQFRQGVTIHGVTLTLEQAQQIAEALEVARN